MKNTLNTFIKMLDTVDGPQQMIQEYARIFGNDIIDFGKKSVDTQNHLINKIYNYVDKNFRGTFEYNIINEMLVNVEYYFFHINDTLETVTEELQEMNKKYGWNLSEAEIIERAKESYENTQNDERMKWAKAFI